MKRAIIIVLDSLGVGAAADAADFDSLGANTLAHVLAAAPTPLPQLQQLGLGNLLPLASVPPAAAPLAAYGRLAPRSSGKDTTSGHWEMAGLILQRPMPTYPQGFPAEIIETFSIATGRGVLGNKVASGTQIIQELGEEHLRTGKLIVYTSADSVFQIAAHEQAVPLTELYAACLKARRILQGEHGVGRVIARPFTGAPGHFTRTANRRDYSLLPPANGLLNQVRRAGLSVGSVGKIKDIFAGQDITTAWVAHSNAESMAATLQALDEQQDGLIFSNFVDFDMLYGHRNDSAGYAAALAEFDAYLPRLLDKLKPEDILFLTADHGNDPSSSSTDHDRENVPLLAYGAAVQPTDLGLRDSFADLGATCAAYLDVGAPPAGVSFLAQILGE